MANSQHPNLSPQAEEGVKELDNFEALRLRLKHHPNRVMLLTAMTDEHGELVGFVFHSVGKLEKVSS